MNKQQAFIFFGIILAGLGISIYSLNQWGKKEVVGEPDPEPIASNPGTPDKTPSPAAVPSATPQSAPDTPPAEKKFETAEALVGALIETVKKRDVDGFMAVAGEKALSPEIRPQVEGLLRDPAWSPNPSKPVSELAKSSESVRWAIHLDRQAGAAPLPGAEVNPSATPVTTDLYADIARSNETKEWSVLKIALPFDFAEKTGLHPGTVAMKPGETPPGTTPAPGSPGAPGTAPMPAASVDASDALTVAHAFSKALIDRNFDLARNLTDTNRVTDERLAALMIALEEGAFHLREDKPLIVTLSREDLTWVLTRVDSEAVASEFAVEMGKTAPSPDWKVNGLTFSKVIAALADQAGAGGVAYAPIVADPQGGDSLVLYFEFDEGEVNARSARQLRIVADILRQDPNRKIHINGHADALGTDDYNESLSNTRAAAIRSKLIEFGVGTDQVLTKAFGEAMPRRPNFNPDGTDNPDNRSQNRRAEVYLDF